MKTNILYPALLQIANLDEYNKLIINATKAAAMTIKISKIATKVAEASDASNKGNVYNAAALASKAAKTAKAVVKAASNAAINAATNADNAANVFEVAKTAANILATIADRAAKAVKLAKTIKATKLATNAATNSAYTATNAADIANLSNIYNAVINAVANVDDIATVNAATKIPKLPKVPKPSKKYKTSKATARIAAKVAIKIKTAAKVSIKVNTANKVVKDKTDTKANANIFKPTISAKLIKYNKRITLIEPTKSLESNSWFDIIQRKNNESNTIIPEHYDYKYMNTKVILLDLTDEQQIKIKLWLDDLIDVYNLTNKYIKAEMIITPFKHTGMKNNIESNHVLYKDFNTLVNYESLQEILKDETNAICGKNDLPKRQVEFQIKHCVTMYKSSYSNFIRKQKKDIYCSDKYPDYINKPITEFNITDLCKDIRLKNLIMDERSVSKKINTLFPTIFKEGIKSNIDLSIIEKGGTILQLDTLKNKFIIITPYERDHKVKLEQNNQCGIDPGLRTFLTVYSPEESYEICTNTYELIDKYHKKLDSLKSSKDKNIITLNKYNSVREKYQTKLNNYINDLHAKSSRFILKKFKTVKLGNINIKSIVSNETGNIDPINKRRILALSHGKFKMKLQQMSVKWNNEIILVNEYKTSKTCCECGNEKNDLGPAKTYKCSKCLLTIDRDINAAINIYNKAGKTIKKKSIKEITNKVEKTL